MMPSLRLVNKWTYPNTRRIADTLKGTTAFYLSDSDLARFTVTVTVAFAVPPR